MRAVLSLVGSGWPALQGEPPFAHWVERGQLLVRGKLSAQELRAEYAAARLFVAPVRNATGVATKNFHSMGSGLPVLTTAMGLAGMKLPPRDLGLCCDASASNTWPRECKPSPKELQRRRGWEGPDRPSLEADCRRAPKRLECAAYAAARRAAASAAPARDAAQASSASDGGGDGDIGDEGGGAGEIRGAEIRGGDGGGGGEARGGGEDYGSRVGDGAPTRWYRDGNFDPAVAAATAVSTLDSASAGAFSLPRGRDLTRSLARVVALRAGSTTH